MHDILVWAIHDLFAYGLLSSHVTKGYKGCMACGPNTCSHHSKKLCKLPTSITASGYCKTTHIEGMPMTLMVGLKEGKP
jgi:hypothetical protein